MPAVEVATAVAFGEGRRKLDINGKPTYVPVFEWRTRELRERFPEAVVALVRQAHPDDLD